MPIDQHDFLAWLQNQVEQENIPNKDVDTIAFWIGKYVGEVSAKEERFRPKNL